MRTATNKREATCEACGVALAPGHGEVTRDAGGAWHCKCPAAAWAECARRRHAPKVQGALPGFEGDVGAAETPEALAARSGLSPEAAEAERARERAIERVRREDAILGAAEVGSPRHVAGILADVFCEASPATRAGDGVTANLARLALLDPGLPPAEREPISRLVLGLRPRTVARAEMTFEADPATIRELRASNGRGLKALARAVRLALEIKDGDPCVVEVTPIGAEGGAVAEQERRSAA